MIAAYAWNLELNGLAQHGGDALLRASLQGGLALAAAGLICRMLRRAPARVKCWIWRLAYLKVLLAFAWAVPLELPVLRAEHRHQTMAAATDVVHRASPNMAAIHPMPLADAASASHVALADAPLAPHGLEVLWLAWLGFTICLAARMVFQLRAAAQLRRRCTQIADEPFTHLLQRTCAQCGVSRPPMLLTSDSIAGPLLLGPIRPAIVLPTLLMGESPARLRLILAHELAHLRRQDLWWNWIPAIAELLLFFHPLVWLARREWRVAQEVACDEATLAATQAGVVEYGQTLLSVAISRRLMPSLAAVGILDSRNTLHRRFVAMKNLQPWSVRRLAVAGVAISFAAVLTLVPWRAVAQQGGDVPESNAVKDTPRPQGDPTMAAIALKKARATEMKDIVDSIFKEAAPNGTKLSVAADERTNTLILSGPGRMVKLMQQMLYELDAEADVSSIKKRYLKIARDMRDAGDQEELREHPDAIRDDDQPAVRQRTKLTKAGAAAAYRVVGTVTAPTAGLVVPVDGVVLKVLMKEGDRVKAGQPLVVLDNRKAEAALAEQRARLKASSVSLSRTREMRDQNVVSKWDLEQAQIQVELEQAVVDQKAQEVDAATIKAAMNGVITKCAVQPGQFLQKGTSFGEVIDVDSLQVAFDVDAAVLDSLSVGDEVTIQSEYDSSKSYPTHITYITARVDSQTNTVLVRTSRLEGAGRLKPGMHVNVTLATVHWSAEPLPKPAVP